MELDRFADLEDWSAYINAIGKPSTPDDNCKTLDGRTLSTKAEILEHLRVIEAARTEGRSLEP